MAGVDYYEILGVERTASNDEIKQAYFSLARQYHPDSNPSESAAEFFLVLQKAYETLRNPKKRKEHDLMLLQAEPEVEMINVSCQLSASEIPIPRFSACICIDGIGIPCRQCKISSDYDSPLLCYRLFYLNA